MGKGKEMLAKRRKKRPWISLLSLLVLGVFFVGWSSGEDAARSSASAAAPRAFAQIPASNQTHLFRQNSLIIPMDTTYQDRGVLLAYGLLYRLLKEGVPVHWVIKAGKSRGDVDFTAKSKDLRSGQSLASHGYRGGPFVVEAIHLTG